jgi:VIT1/CCC1 family predicted Fe2+/Mn2+ transporter
MKEKRIKILWILCSTSAALLSALYIICDFIIPDDMRSTQVSVFLALGIVSIILSIIALLKARTILKIMALLNIALGLLLVFWTYFVLTFNFTF